MATLFRRFDINRDGAVSYQELRDGLRSMKVALSDNEVRALFNRLDADHDGSVTQEELLDASLRQAAAEALVLVATQPLLTAR